MFSRTCLVCVCDFFVSGDVAWGEAVFFEKGLCEGVECFDLFRGGFGDVEVTDKCDAEGVVVFSVDVCSLERCVSPHIYFAVVCEVFAVADEVVVSDVFPSARLGVSVPYVFGEVEVAFGVVDDYSLNGF